MSKSRVFLIAVLMLLVGGGIAAFVTHQVHVTSAKNRGSVDNPVTLPDDMIRKITGKGGFSERTFKAEFYNGTDWTLTDIDVVVSKKKKGQERRFRLEMWDKKIEWQKDARGPNTSKTKMTLIPYATGEFEGDIGDFLDGVETKEEWSFWIESARGFKQ